ncbi:uncharacterized protein A1O5_01405 [Cladophialophora psammophila CBS 110553]|uniref:Uncharacterized protein n=1 Tax=Cladophialophora psammophila CBS 110553 TaxID=1182543 RepID=W9XBJ8_9EURO|nr:uncharacterized protein A1O5_01405 [Cladophialophora psammophila CBS 110553]EXJ74710.1 hypothetical protein A1O5_01405 [Cladophialophora psammophila CBS 110553]
MSVANGERSRKRRKVEADAPLNTTSISSSDQLHQLLQFSPSTSPEDIKAAVNRFTEFLSNFANEESPEGTRQLKVLKKYCDEQSSASHDQLDFANLLSAWSNASQSNAEAVLAAIPRCLAQFFETISSHVEFREFGISLCHSLLKRDQLRIIDRSLSSPRSKEHLITPCLQLLTEIISFDGGALASNVFSRRDFLYRRLEGILSQTPATLIEGSSVTAQQVSLEFILANLRYLDSTSKSELITHGKTIFLAVRNLPNLPVDIVINILKGLERSIIGDGNLSKQIKIRCFNSGVLSALAKLYGYKTQGNDGPAVEVRNALQQLLLQVCTTPKGVLLAQSGWYPTGTNPETPGQDENMIDLGLDSPFYFDDYAEKVPVKNGALSAFIQTLRPESDVQQADLIVALFNAAPELVADYLTKKPKFVVPPGDDPKWRGQFAFLFSVVQLPVPQNCGWDEKLPLNPPPLSVVIESILPRPLDRATIGKCLRMNDEIMTISATRLLTMAFEKLDSVLKVFEKAPAESHLWKQASGKLISLFVERIPPLQDVITALQKLEKENEPTRTVVLECIAAYHTILPSITAGSKFDFGVPLSKGLQSLESDALDTATKDIVLGQIVHIMQIAYISPATKWFHKAASEDVSLIVQLLRRCVKNPDKLVTKEALPILKGVLTNKGILNTNVRSTDALISSLNATKKWQPELVAYQFLDNCMSRTVQRPVKYLDQLEQAQQFLSDSTPLSLLACCVAEQWIHLLKKEKKQGIKNVAEWVAGFFSALDSAGENYRVMMHLKEEMLKQCDGNEKAKETLEKAFEKQRKRHVVLSGEHLGEADSKEREVPEGGADGPAQQQHAGDLDLVENFPPPPAIPTSLAGLDRWTKPDFESEIQTGRLANLIRSLISPEPEVRLQAFHILQHIIHAVQQSSYDEKTQLYLLLGELCETIKSHVLSNSQPTATAPPPPPSIVAELAIHFLPTISDPSSPFYRKTNSFLLRAPQWSVPHILPYWLKETFLTEPEIDDPDIPATFQQGSGGGSGGNINAQALEIEHFLDLLLKSLRTETDMDLLRRAQVFTRLFSHYLAPVCTKAIRTKILRVVHFATRIKGGSETLITRTGVREWLSVAKTLRGHSGHGIAGFGKMDHELVGLVQAVEMQVLGTSDAEAIARWEAERRVFREAEHAAKDNREEKQDLASKIRAEGARGESESESENENEDEDGR